MHYLCCMCGMCLKRLFCLPHNNKLFQQTFVPVVGQQVTYDMVAAVSVATSESIYVARHTSSSDSQTCLEHKTRHCKRTHKVCAKNISSSSLLLSLLNPANDAWAHIVAPRGPKLNEQKGQIIDATTASKGLVGNRQPFPEVTIESSY